MSFVYGGISNKYIAYGCHYNGCYASYFCWQSQRWHRFACYLIDYLIIGYDILRKAIKGIKNRQVFDESFLMAVATIGAMALAIYENGEYLEAIAVMLFYQIGEWFQGYEVGIGSMIVVQTGEKVPIDGIIVGGVSSLNTSALTFLVISFPCALVISIPLIFLQALEVQARKAF